MSFAPSSRPRANTGAERSHTGMVFQVNGNRHIKRAGVAGVTLRAVGAGRLHQPLWGRMKGSESVQGATTPPMPQRAAQALWCKPIKARHVASWTAISAGSGRHVYMQQITPEEVLCVFGQLSSICAPSSHSARSKKAQPNGRAFKFRLSVWLHSVDVRQAGQSRSLVSSLMLFNFVDHHLGQS